MSMISVKKQSKKIDQLIMAITAIADPVFEEDEIRVVNKLIHEFAPSPKTVCEPDYYNSVDAVEKTFSFPWAFPHTCYDSANAGWHVQLENGIAVPFKEYYGHAQSEASARLIAYLRAHKGTT